tara:strand:+ start:5840 stop:6172 length:333 start_codon:yes stop_codon:yes gene_type:complete
MAVAEVTLGSKILSSFLTGGAAAAGAGVANKVLGGLWGDDQQATAPQDARPPEIGGGTYKEALANLMRDIPSQTRLSQRTPVTLGSDGGTPRHDRLQTLEAIANVRRGLG